ELVGERITRRLDARVSVLRGAGRALRGQFAALAASLVERADDPAVRREVVNAILLRGVALSAEHHEVGLDQLGAASGAGMPVVHLELALLARREVDAALAAGAAPVEETARDLAARVLEDVLSRGLCCACHLISPRPGVHRLGYPPL